MVDDDERLVAGGKRDRRVAMTSAADDALKRVVERARGGNGVGRSSMMRSVAVLALSEQQSGIVHAPARAEPPDSRVWGCI